MTLALALALLLWPLPDLSAPLHRAEIAAAIDAQEDPALWRAIWHVECTSKSPCGRSAAGACCEMQVLGGRYGNPPCELLDASAWLCVIAADRQMERCRRMCGKAKAAPCYHDGHCNGNGDYARKVRGRKKGCN